MADAELMDSTGLLAHEVGPKKKESALPVQSGERIHSIDVLRGFALCGILAMNVVLFFWPFSVYDNPTLGGGFTGVNKVVWILNHIIFDTKMMSIFSMLFGAGLVLKFEKSRSEGRKLAGVYYRRIFALLFIGLIHAYFIWEGDILVLYAQCGLVLFLFRKLAPRTLVVLGTIGILLVIPLALGANAFFNRCNALTPVVERKVKAGEKLSGFEKFVKNSWPEIKKEMDPPPAERDRKVQEVITIYRGGYWGIVKERAKSIVFIQTVGFIFGVWLAGGRMLLGMGLMKLGVFEAKRSEAFYRRMIALGYGIGLPLVLIDTVGVINANFNRNYMMGRGAVIFGLSSLPMALGHVGVIMLICKRGLIARLRMRLAAVGRMALTNYLMHGLIGTTLGCGYGLGWYGRVERWQMALVVVSIWILQLIVSPIWLKHFRYGPAEWFWRLITYWKPQPMSPESGPA